jgi:endonuclease YncB( thermonuclease family)
VVQVSAGVIALGVLAPNQISAACVVVDAAGAPLGEAVSGAVALGGDEVLLSDGRVIRLVMIAAPRDPLAGPRPDIATLAMGETALARLIKMAEAVRFVPVDPARGAAPLLDRHGRAFGRLLVKTGDTWIDAAESLVRQGAARFSPAHAPSRPPVDLTACALAIRAAEGEARAARRGMFGDAAFAARAATAPDLTASAGAVTVVEGRVVSLGQAGRTTYVNFGDQFTRDFTAWLSDKDRAAWLKTGVDVAVWRGQWVRLRGVLGARDGGSMRLVDPSQAELIAPPPADEAADMNTRTGEAGEAK